MVENSDKTWELFDAICGKNSIANIQRIINDGGNVNAQYGGFTFLHFAVMKNRTDIAQLLIENGAHVNAQATNGSTSLDLAIADNRPDIVKLLIKKGSHVNLRDGSGFILLHAAVIRNQLEILKLLIKNGGDVNSVTENEKLTLLHLAVIENQLEIVQLLLENGANINSVTKTYKHTSLHLAITMNNSNMVRLLIEKGSDVTLKTHDGTTPIQLASKEGNISIIQAIKQALNSRQQNDNSTHSSSVERQDHELNFDRVVKTTNLFRIWTNKINTWTSENTALKNANSKLIKEMNKLFIRNINLKYKRLQEFEENEASNTPSTSRNETNDCCVCQEFQASYAFVSCGHVCLCDGCSEGWQERLNAPSSSMNESDSQFKSCPICKQFPEGIIKLFF